ncbi:MAG: GFA family protein [Alteripontixanthobacter sp.]
MEKSEPLSGGCHCGAIRYEISGDVLNHALCHCIDCRRTSGAPMVGWAMVPDTALTVTGETSVYASSEDARRHFCIQCGTGLFYSNAAMLPGLVDVQSATLDEPEHLPAQAHIQVAERIGWMAEAHHLPMFERYPPQD